MLLSTSVGQYHLPPAPKMAATHQRLQWQLPTDYHFADAWAYVLALYATDVFEL